MVGCVALIVAAGRGARMRSSLPKQYLRLGNAPVLRHSVEMLLAHPGVARVRCVIDPEARDLYDDAVAGLSLDPPVAGGAERQDSVRLGLESLAADAPAHVLIHDAARPFVPPAVVDRVLAALVAHDGAVPALPVQDTLKREADGRIAATVERAGLWRAQTPQGFNFAPILRAHRAAAGQALTDDAAVAEAAGLSVALVSGDEAAFKLTTGDDLRRGEDMLQARATHADTGTIRVGSGFDVHRFGPGDHVTLCGVAIPHGQGLEGHSDADVGLHALTDAILGALAAGDIGSHFPPSDPQWKGADSARFLLHALELARSRAARVEHVDVTLICERPKIGPHREHLVARLAELLGLPADRIGLKATTTEGLGFTGRGEGIAAQAVATLRFGAS